MGRQDGFEGKAYILDAAISVAPVSGFFASVPAGVEILGITDVTANIAMLGSFDTTARNDYLGTDGRSKAKLTATLNLIDRDDAVSFITRLQAAAITGAEVPMAILDGPIGAAARGVMGNFQVHSMTNGQPLNDKGTFDFEVRPSSYPGAVSGVSA